jgi:hypothetical protein
MSPRETPSFPAKPFGLLLVEGGDEESLCKAVAETGVWAELCCWNARGRDSLRSLAGNAKRQPNFGYVRSVGLVLDTEGDPQAALKLAEQTLTQFGHNLPLVHGAVAGQPLRCGVFLSPDGQSAGSTEGLCRAAVRDLKVAACVDALVVCSTVPHPNKARADKAWLQAYLAMFPEPHRFHDAFDPEKGNSIDPSHRAFDPLRSFLRSL